MCLVAVLYDKSSTWTLCITWLDLITYSYIHFGYDTNFIQQSCLCYCFFALVYINWVCACVWLWLCCNSCNHMRSNHYTMKCAATKYAYYVPLSKIFTFHKLNLHYMKIWFPQLLLYRKQIRSYASKSCFFDLVGPSQKCAKFTTIFECTSQSTRCVLSAGHSRK